jgi:hypothetical protein
LFVGFNIFQFCFLKKKTFIFCQKVSLVFSIYNMMSLTIEINSQYKVIKILFIIDNIIQTNKYYKRDI